MRRARKGLLVRQGVWLALAATVFPGSGAAFAAASSQDVALAPPPRLAEPGPVPVTGHPDPLSLLDDEDATLAANKRLVFDMWRSVVNAGHVEVADDLLQPDYIQHSPVLPTGRDAFKTIFSAVPRREIPALVSPPLVTILAEGDLVVMALAEEQALASGDGRYTTTHFNLFRAERGRLAEHWHSVQTAPGADVLPPESGGPQPVTGAVGSAQLALLQAADPVLAGNKRFVFDAWRQVIQAGREDLADRYFAGGYIEHDPNFGSGLPALKLRLAGQPDEPVAQAIDAPLVTVLAQGDLVVLVYGREHPHPHRAGKTYTTTLFDMFRITDGRIAEHWNGASRPDAAVPEYGN